MFFKCIFCCHLDVFYIQFIRSFNFTYIHINHSVYIYIFVQQYSLVIYEVGITVPSPKSFHLTSLNILSDSFYIFILILVLYIACRNFGVYHVFASSCTNFAITSHLELPVRAPKNFNIKKFLNFPVFNIRSSLNLKHSIRSSSTPLWNPISWSVAFNPCCEEVFLC